MSTSIVEGLREAEGITEPSDYISRIKGLVTVALMQIDPSAKVEDTKYFNHSAIPDFVVKWSGRPERLIYLRDSYQSIAANHDPEHLDRAAPFILAYSHDSSESVPEAEAASRIIGSMRPASRTLVTEPRVLAQLGPRPSAEESPLKALVRGNLISGGRGLIDERAGLRVLEPLQADANIGSLFAPEIAARISQARTIMAIALEGSELVPLPLPRDQAIQVLPWLLVAEGVRQDAEFWRAVGEELTLEFLLKDMRESISGLDLSALVRANADRLYAKRGYLGANIVSEDSPNPPSWAIRSGRLERRVGDVSMIFSANHHLPGAESASSATWEQLKQALESFVLRSVSLRGLRRDVQLDTERSHDLRADVASITSSLEDQYFVDRVIVASSADDEEKLVADLDKRLVIAQEGAALTDMTNVLSKIVGYRQPVEIDELK